MQEMQQRMHTGKAYPNAIEEINYICLNTLNVLKSVLHTESMEIDIQV